MGPVGSGKSSCCSVEVARRAISQAPGPDRLRRSRFGVIRNTYRELMDTTVKTFCDWFPEGQWGHFNRGDMTYYLEAGDVRSEIVFRALDRPQDVKKLLSAEYTGAWVNEAREIPLPVVQMLETRVGRYPSMKDGIGATWYGIFMDTNPPDSDHWWYTMFEELKPTGWRLFRQPSGRADNAENRAHLKPDYYERLLSGKDEDWVRVYVDGEYGYVREGKPVYPEYRDAIHCRPCSYLPNTTVVVGLDFGLTPAAVFCQMTTRGQWRALSELVATDMGVVRFSEVLGREMQQRYPGAAFQVWGDPSGDQREADERTCFDILRAHKILAMPAPGNNEWSMRREAVAQPLSRLIDGVPGLAIDPACVYVRKGLAGKYEYRRLQVAGDARFEEKPNKNEYSHPCFIAGTLIGTPAGSIPIERLRSGDSVSTPLGSRVVTMTGVREAPVVTMGHATCTADHPFWTARGFVPADALRYGEVLGTRHWAWTIHWWLSHYAPRRVGRFMSSMVAAITGVRRGITEHFRAMAANICTVLCGWLSTGLSLQDSMCITSTATATTTGLPIFRRSALPNIAGSICWNLTDERDPAESCADMRSQQRLSGGETIQRTLPRSAERGPQDYGEPSRSQSPPCSAVTAASGSRAWRSPSSGGFVHRLANRLLVVLLAWTTRSATANDAERSTARISTAGYVSAAGVAPVYMLEVAEAHCYYANGILVSNCEALQYALLGGGENAKIIKSAQLMKPVTSKNRWNPLNVGR